MIFVEKNVLIALATEALTFGFDSQKKARRHRCIAVEIC